MRPGLDEVVAPHVVPMRRTKAHARTVIEPQPSSLGLFLRHFEPFLPPETFDPFVIDSPSPSMKKLCHSAITVPSVLSSQCHHVLDQPGFVIRHVSLAALG
jgi:hypothetical protein